MRWQNRKKNKKRFVKALMSGRVGNYTNVSVHWSLEDDTVEALAYHFKYGREFK